VKVAKIFKKYKLQKFKLKLPTIRVCGSWDENINFVYFNNRRQCYKLWKPNFRTKLELFIKELQIFFITKRNSFYEKRFSEHL
jgi:hypothetical protein